MSSLTISSTTAIVAHAESTPPSSSDATATTDPQTPQPPPPSHPPQPSQRSQPSQTPPQQPQPQPQQPLQRRWWPGTSTRPRGLPRPDWSNKLRLIRVQQCFIAGVALLELFTIILIVVLNSSGEQADRLAVSAPDMYLLQASWPKNATVDARENRTDTYTLYWYLNGLSIQNGSGPLVSLHRQAGADFDWRAFDNLAGRHIYENRGCNSVNVSPVPIINMNASAPYSNHTGETICDLPRPDVITDEPAALNGQPVFGRASFALYVVDLAITGFAWPFVFWFTGKHRWQKRGRIVLACIKAFATIINVVAAALLAAGVAWIAKTTGPAGSASGTISAQDAAPFTVGSDAMPFSNAAVSNVTNSATNSTSPTTPPTSTMPVITAGPTASNMIWIAAIAQIFATVFFIASSLLLWQQERNQGVGSGRSRLNMRQRPGSLPVYRPRDSNTRRRGDHNADDDDDEDLPPYQRDDPLGRPPSIPGYTISNGCTVTFSAFVVASGPDCIPLNRVGSGSSSSDADVEASASSSTLSPGLLGSNSGRRSPSPDYEEVVGVEPVSLLSSDGSSTPHESGLEPVSSSPSHNTTTTNTAG
ncbi:hypothetical protein SBRCBS47491_007221 [Sporothrix bragantina]|uniref:Integral membrane protein n=1 Tax=Sporothrix bragantina TaxID=671064 RepID=A0ABP0CCK3_9PEZI